MSFVCSWFSVGIHFHNLDDRHVFVYSTTCLKVKLPGWCVRRNIFFSYGFKEIMKVSQRLLVFFAGFVMQRLFTHVTNFLCNFLMLQVNHDRVLSPSSSP